MGIRYNGHNISLGTIKLVRYNGHTIYNRTSPFEGLCFTSEQDGSSIAYTITGSINAHIQISGDGYTWQDWDGTSIAIQSGGKIYVKNLNNTLSIDASNYFKFSITGRIRASGSIMSMINNSSISNYCFTRLFRGCYSLIHAPSLPATELARSCYQYMFYDCTGLTSAPSLPATQMASNCYSNMFYGCTSLTSAPSLPATNLEEYCYNSMFAGCTGLTSAPSLPATNLKNNCYSSMFFNCSGLTSIPRLPSTNLAHYCYYQMFKNCSSLKVQENGQGGSLIFRCPSLTGINDPVNSMFGGTAGTFTSTPSDDRYYYYYNYTITKNITGGTATGDSFISAGGTARVVITPHSGYALPQNITVTGASYIYTRSTGEITLDHPTGDITINVECVASIWYLDNAYINSLTVADIGTTKTITVNGQTHTVRLIGIDHDDLADGTGKAHTTWEFANIISDTNGNSLGIVWNDTNDTSSSGTCNKDYINSSIRKALCGNGNFSGDILYAQKGATSFSATYKNRTILSMLPSDLVAVLKTTKKSVGIGESYTETSYTDKLFMLSPIEMGYTNQYDKGFGSTYSYYSGHTEQTDAIRIKKQVNNSEVYTSSSNIPSGSGQAYQGTVYNYAGYNYKTDNTGGGFYWYRSPYSSFADSAWDCYYDGICYYIVAYYRAYGVAPAFCLGIGSSSNKIKTKSYKQLKNEYRKIVRR